MARRIASIALRLRTTLISSASAPATRRNPYCVA